jgi:hypothetical protein
MRKKPKHPSLKKPQNQTNKQQQLSLLQHPCASKQKNTNSRKKHKWVRERYPKRETRRGRRRRRRRRRSTCGFLFYFSLTELQEEKKSGGKSRKTQQNNKHKTHSFGNNKCATTQLLFILLPKKNTTKNIIHINHATASHTVEEDESCLALPCLAFAFLSSFPSLLHTRELVSLLE